FLDPAVCLYPFPSDFFTVADGTTDSGKRVNFTTVAMPKNNAGVFMNPSDYNWNDGFSPGVTILTRVPGVDLAMTGAAPITDIARSLDSTAPVVLVNSSTLVHHLMFVELDANATTEAKRAMIIHPSVNLDEGTTYIVALRDMKHSSGTILTPNADFLAYRDNIPPRDPGNERRRPRSSCWTATASPRTSRRLSRRRSCATSRAPRCRPGPGPPSRRARRSMGTGSSAPTPRCAPATSRSWPSRTTSYS